jgi:hypothetical protein
MSNLAVSGKMEIFINNFVFLIFLFNMVKLEENTASPPPKQHFSIEYMYSECEYSEDSRSMP